MKKRKIFIINNPISIYFLITDVFSQVDEIWIEFGVCPAIDNYIDEVIEFLRTNFIGIIKPVEIPNIFEINKVKLIDKYFFYSRIAKVVNKMIDDNNVSEIVCTTTSSFRLSKVSHKVILDHGTGDYTRAYSSLLMDRCKFSLFSRNLFYKKVKYASLLPTRHTEVVKITSEFMFVQNSIIAKLLNNLSKSIIILVDPAISLKSQITRFVDNFKIEDESIYLKFHHFHWKRQVVELESLPTDIVETIHLTLLPDEIQWLPVEAICMKNSSKVILAGFDSSALWHLSYFFPNRTLTLISREELKARNSVWEDNLERLVKQLGFSPYDSKN